MYHPFIHFSMVFSRCIDQSSGGLDFWSQTMIALLRLVTFCLVVSAVGAQDFTALLEWNSSLSSDVTGYQVYRRSGAETQYQRITSSPVSGLTFSDPNVLYGQIYHYTATAVSSTGMESIFADEITLDLICRGDVNMDRQRNVLDVVQMQNHIVGNMTLQSNAQTAGDVDGDGQISVLDAVRMLNFVVGNLSLPDCIR
jgi:hypothetical protein